MPQSHWLPSFNFNVEEWFAGHWVVDGAIEAPRDRAF
jgi:hypothetical protein